MAVVTRVQSKDSEPGSYFRPEVGQEGDAGHEIQLDRSYGAYRAVLADVINASPQFQGFTEEEFAASMADPNTLFSPVLDEAGREVMRVPQLVPLEQFEWLNHEEYAKLFPGRRVEHYTAFEGVEPSEDVLLGLDSLADDGGILAFDFPDALPEYEDRLRAVLAERGLRIVEDRHLGTQTYYAGKVTLKRGYKAEQPITDFSEAFQKMEAEGKINAGSEDGATYTSRIDPVQAERLYAFYQDAFASISDHPCRQGFTPEEFLEVVAEKQNIAKLQYATDGEVETVCVLGNDLDDFPWLNSNFYEGLFPEEMDEKQVLYFPAIATDPKKNGGNNSEKIVNLIAEMVEYANNEIIVAFDCCTKNKGFLDAFLEVFINATPQANIKFQQIGEQQYKAYRLERIAA